jgi:hypothetical protein
LEQLELRLEDSVEAIDVHQEAQELVKLFAHSQVFTVKTSIHSRVSRTSPTVCGQRGGATFVCCI